MIGNAKRRRPNRKLIELRINAGLSRRALASHIDVSAPTIGLAEKGHLPDPRVQHEIADFFGVAATDIWPLSSQIERMGVQDG